MRIKALASLLLAAMLIPIAPVLGAEGVGVQWFGQSAFRITSPNGKVIVIDPFLTQNPMAPDKYRDLDAMGDVDLILVTHAHGDHWGDTAALARKTGAKVALNADFGSTIRTLGILPGEQLIRFNKSGPIQPLGGEITITMVHAEHSSAFTHENAAGEPAVFPGGAPVGYIIEFADGYTVYHMGDTGVFGGMEWIGHYYRPDLALVPIGGHFTMDPEHAAYALKRFVRPKQAVPIHYGTFPPLRGTPQEFTRALGDSPIEVTVMEPGGSHRFGR